jgi:hypothetical protein
MNSLSALKPLLLTEIILVLTICLIVVFCLLHKQRSLLKKVHNKFINLHANQNSLDTYFTQAIEETLERYEKSTHSNTIVFDVSRPYSEKVTALRYIYLNVEKDAEERKKSSKIGWNFYEDRFELLMGLINKPSVLPENTNLKEELHEFKTESKVVISKLKDILASLQTSPNGSSSLISNKEYKEALDSIISNDNLDKIRSLFDEMKFFSDNFEPKKDNYIEKSIHTLEYEVESSDRSIASIRTSTSPESPANMYEINKLKASNKIQKGIISNLEKEIFSLRGSIDVNSTQEIKDIKEEEINRLERVVKEYEGCVIILEDQIDNLYTRLEEKAKESAINESSESGHGLQDLNAELESVSKRMDNIANNYRQAVALNRSIYNFGQCKTIKDIASNIVKLLKELNVSTGFYIQSSVGKADYFPSLLFNDTLKKLVKNTTLKEHIGQLNGNALFTSYGIKMIIFPSEGEADSINSTISGLVCVASDNIRRLENTYILKKNSANIDSWVSLAKNKIANIDIQFSYQAEENKKIYNQFIVDLKKSYGLLDLKGEGAVLLDSAINEYEMRMHLLLSGGDVINKELAKLISHLGALKLQASMQNE